MLGAFIAGGLTVGLAIYILPKVWQRLKDDGKIPTWLGGGK